MQFMRGKRERQKASGLKTAPPGHHKTRRDRQVEAIARARAQTQHPARSRSGRTDFTREELIARHERRIAMMVEALTPKLHRRPMEGEFNYPS